MHALWISINLHTCMLLRFSLKFSLLTSWIVVHRDSGDLKSNEDQWKQEKHLIHNYPSVSLSWKCSAAVHACCTFRMEQMSAVKCVWWMGVFKNFKFQQREFSSIISKSLILQRVVWFLEGFEQVPPCLHELMVCIPSPIYTCICVRVFRACGQLWWN